MYQPDQLKRNVEKVEKLKPIASRYGVSTAQLVLAWYMKNPLIGPVIPGARTTEQLLANVASVSIALRDEDYQAIDHIFASANL
ncbi:oxidoreductase ion channel [Sporolactobacillus inulinus]|uniref:Oxidoreductase ion channel n=1 Tax=Sporolactobacillus inulinus TaxID=2078 RepID=A0A4Y1ZIA4_9BACL|nr:oxidoreductase ion channel [Sporolactobacillus inulinus]